MSRLLAIFALSTLVLVGNQDANAAEIRKGRSPIPRRLGPPPAYVDDAAVVDFVNGQVRASWKQAGLESSPPATAGEWCRRVYLDIIGRIPTVDELARFQRDPAARARPSWSIVCSTIRSMQLSTSNTGRAFGRMCSSDVHPPPTHPAS